MLRRLFPLVVVLSAGCVPINEPLGDIDKAEPDKGLVGTWAGDGDGKFVVGHPAVKGNPKGLMRGTFIEKGKENEEVKDENRFWFYTTAVGKYRYANVLIVQGDKYPTFAQMNKEGEFAAWTKNDKRGYGIVRYTAKGDDVSVFDAKDTVLEALMKAEKFPEVGGIFQAKPGWIAKHLEKKEADDLFASERKFKRVKK
jgi:hypothetical protein